MILSELRRYLALHRQASLADLANRFDTDADALRGMLGKLIAKGTVRKLPEDLSPCKGCCKCESANAEIYQWQDPGG